MYYPTFSTRDRPVSIMRHVSLMRFISLSPFYRPSLPSAVAMVVNGSRCWYRSSVIGTDVPSFHQFPYCAQEVLHLYRSFLRLIYHHHHLESERRDLLFKLRQEFAGRRHLKRPRMIASALRRGQGILTFHQQLVGSSRGSSQLTRKEKERLRRDGATSVNDVWDQFQLIAGNVTPGLSHYHCSRPIRSSATSHSSVHSRRSIH